MEQEAAASMWGELKVRKAEIERLQSSGAPSAQIERAKAELSRARTEAAAADAKVVERHAEAQSAVTAMRSEVQARTAKVQQLKSKGASAEEVAEAEAALVTLERQLETADSLATAMKVADHQDGHQGCHRMAISPVIAPMVILPRDSGEAVEAGQVREEGKRR